MTDETVQATLQKLGVRWLRAKRWIRSPETPSTREKRRRDQLIELVAKHPVEVISGFRGRNLVEVRLALPSLHGWSEEGEPLRLCNSQSPKTIQTPDPDDPDPKALSCYGLFLPELQRTWLRFVVPSLKGHLIVH